MPIHDVPTATEEWTVNSPTAAKLLNSTNASLEKDRAKGHLGIPYAKVGRRVVYRLSDLNAWLNGNLVIPREGENLACNDTNECPLRRPSAKEAS